MRSATSPRSLSLCELKDIAITHPIQQGFYSDTTKVTSFEELPVTGKDELLRLLTDSPLDTYKSCYISPSGATGGSSVYFPVTIEENHLYREMFARHLVRAGILSPDEVYLNLFFHDHCYRSLEIFDEFSQLAGATAVNVGTESSNSEMLAILKKFRCTCMWTHL